MFGKQLYGLKGKSLIFKARELAIESRFARERSDAGGARPTAELEQASVGHYEG